MNILIVGGGLQGLSCGESLSKKGYVVDAISNDLQIRKSCFFRKVYIDENKEKLDTLFQIIKENTYDVLIPMGDKTVSLMSSNKRRIEEVGRCKCACPENSVLTIVEDKHRFMAFCESNNIPHPKTEKLLNSNIGTCAKQIGFPALIKPNFSVGARGIVRVDSLDELNDKYSVVQEKFGSCTLQELIENEEFYYNVMLYRDINGNFLAHAISKIVRMYPVHAGSSSCLITVENEELLRICKDCLDKLNWVGMADLDVLQRLDNGEYKIIEINARVPASLRAASISGVNFPELMILDVTGKHVPMYCYKPGKTLRYLGIDIMWLLKSGFNCSKSPNWLHFFGRNVFYQDIYGGDFSTWWTWLVEGLGKISKRRKRIR